MSFSSVFERVFQAQYQRMPESWQRFHHVVDEHCYMGEAEVRRGGGLASRLLCGLMRLPKSGKVPVVLRLTKEGQGERWHRRFGDSCFESCLTAAGSLESERDGHHIQERLGFLSFFIRLEVKDQQVHWHIDSWRFAGVALPRFLMPLSRTVEAQDAEGRYQFDIDLSLMGGGRLIAYRGWLLPYGV